MKGTGAKKMSTQWVLKIEAREDGNIIKKALKDKGRDKCGANGVSTTWRLWQNDWCVGSA
jgi:hypothetical protein